MTGATVVLTGYGLDVTALARIAREDARVTLDPVVRPRLERAHAIVERYAREGAPAYGVTTGLGAAVDTKVSGIDQREFQRRVVLARSVGVGPRAPRDVVRAMAAARAAGLAVGGSGASPAVLDGLVALLNAHIHPVVPMSGSVGAADLAPLAHLSLPLIGLGEAEHNGEVLPGAEALRRAGLAPLQLAAKDGLALVSSNAASIGPGALVVVDAARTLEAMLAAAAMSFEGYAANPSPLDVRAQAAHRAPGQGEAAARLCRLLEGSSLWSAGTPRNLQDPLSFRCVAQVIGSALAALDVARQAVELELNSAGDNPLVLANDGLLLSNGNFHVAHLALAFEMLGQALAAAAAMTVERAMKLMSPRFAELPRFLSPRQEGRTGFATTQKTLAALEADIRHLANPISLLLIPVADRVEDHGTLAPRVVGKTAEIVERLRLIVAIELMVAAQAIDLRRPAKLGIGTAAAHAGVRALVQPLDEDRITAPDIEALDRLIADGGLARTLHAAAGG